MIKIEKKAHWSFFQIGKSLFEMRISNLVKSTCSVRVVFIQFDVVSNRSDDINISKNMFAHKSYSMFKFDAGTLFSREYVLKTHYYGNKELFPLFFLILSQLEMFLRLMRVRRV